MEIREKQFHIEKTTNIKALRHKLGELEEQEEGQYKQGEFNSRELAFTEQKNALREKEVHIFETQRMTQGKIG